MSPNGTLIAFSATIDIKAVRDQVALISMVWKEHAVSKTPLKILTIESDSCNILVRAIQPALLLVLIGSRSSSSLRSFKITCMSTNEATLPSSHHDGDTSILQVQTRKLESLAKYIETDLGFFILPEDAQYARSSA